MPNKGGDALARVAYSRDGDRAEITNKAMDLYNNQKTNGETPLAQHKQNDPSATLTDYQPRTPSPYIAWPETPRTTLDFTLPPTASQGITPPGNAPTSSMPQAPIQPDFEPTNFTPPSYVPPSNMQPGSTGASAQPSDNPMTPVSLDALTPPGSCTTCESRRYVDQSDDASVSYQTPTKISAGMSAAAVAAHEQEHVSNERAKAHRDGREIINQTVTLTYDLCPECGRHFVSGGTTRTTSVGKSEPDDGHEFHNVTGEKAADTQEDEG
jgi:hypothetical protein